MTLKLTKSFSTFLGRIESWLKEFIEEFPEFLNSFAEGYQKIDLLDPVSRHEHFLKRHAQRDKYVFGKRCVFRVHSLWSLAEFYRSHYRYTEAEHHYLHCAELLLSAAASDKQLPFEFRKKLTFVINFLALYYKFKDAEALLRRFLPHVERLSSNEEKASDLELLALICSKLGKNEEAVSCLIAAQEILIPIYGPISQRTIELLERHRRTLTELQSEIALRKCNKHLELLNTVFINEKALGQDNVYNASALRDLSAFYRTEKMHEFADNLLTRAEIAYLANAVKGVAYPALAHDLRKLASLYRKRGDLADETMAFHAERRADSLQPKRVPQQTVWSTREQD